jgi:hypothetical protein
MERVPTHSSGLRHQGAAPCRTVVGMPSVSEVECPSLGDQTELRDMSRFSQEAMEGQGLEHKGVVIHRLDLKI